MLRRIPTILCLLVLLSASLSTLTIAEGTGDDGDWDGPAVQDAPVLLHLKAGTFDPLVEDGPGPSWLRSSPTHPYYVVQFDGPIQKAWRDVASDTGAELLDYLSDYAYFARLTPRALEEVRGLDHVRYVGPAHAAYRVHPSLWTPTVEPVDVAMVTWGTEAAGRLAMTLVREGARVHSMGVDTLVARASPLHAMALAADPSLAVSWVEPYFTPEPHLDNDARTANARQQSDGPYRMNDLSAWSYNAASDAFEGWTGRNVSVAVGDSGLDDSHPAFDGRIEAYYDYGNDGRADYHGHGTHCAGIVLGDGSWRSSDSGVDGKYSGLAPEAGLVVQEVLYGIGSIALWNRDTARSGATISSNSWGAGYFGDYSSTSRAYDDDTRDADAWSTGDQPVLFSFSAGNEGAYGSNSITPPATGKNVITVGATGNDKFYVSSNTVADFSSQGPCDDGRLKPDIVIPGHQVVSARSTDSGACDGWWRPADGYTSYVYASGTSMAAPGVAGAAAVLTQYLVEAKDIADPSPAILKANLINGARPLSGYAYPGNVQGWGAVDLAKTLFDNGTYRIWREDQAVELDTSSGSNESTYWFMVESDRPLKVTLVWTDPGGTSASGKHLINDLDLELVSPTGARYSGNNFDGGQSVSDGGGSRDRLNNVEGFLVNSPARGIWTIRVSAFNVPQGPQDFALVVSGNVEQGHVDLTARSLKVSPTDVEEYHLATLTATLKNLGNRMSDAFRYKVERIDPKGNAVTLGEGGIGGLDAGKGTTMSWDFSGVRGTHILRVTLDPGGLIAESDEDNNVVELEFFFKGYDVRVSTAEPEKSTDPGTLVEFSMTVRNRGNTADEVRVTLTEAPTGWTAQIGADTLSIEAGKSTVATVSVIPPATAMAGERMELTFTATSLGNTTKTRSRVISTTVNQIFGLELTTTKEHLKLYPGDEGVYTLLVTNPGNGVDVYEVINPTEVSPGWWPKVPEPFVTVNVSDQVEVPVMLSTPDPSPVGSSARFMIVVKSTKSDMETNVTLSAEILQFYDNFYDVTLRTSEAEVGTTIDVPVTIENRGNGPVEYVMDVKAPSSEWQAGFEVPSLEVPGYNSTITSLTFQLPQDAVSLTYTFTVGAMASGGDDLDFDFDITVLQYHEMMLTIVSDVDVVTQGMVSEVKLRLNNLGNGIESAKLLVPELPAYWSFEMASDEVEVPPFGQLDLTINLQTNKETPGGNHTVGFLTRYGPAGTLRSEASTRVTILTRPDLEIRQGVLTVSEVEPSVGSLVLLEIMVENKGGTPAMDVYVQFFISDRPLGQPLYLSSLDPGEVQTLSTNWLTNTSGLHEVSVLVDSTKEVDEMREDNNRATAQVSVQNVDLKTSPGFEGALIALGLVTLVAAMRARRRGGTPGA